MAPVFFAGHGSFIYVTGRNDKVQGMFCIGAKTEQPLQFLKPFVSNDWEYVAI
jgi:hypothetical protein